MAPSLYALAASLLLPVVSSAASCANNTLQTTYPAPVAADGWSYRLVATNFTRPRGILFDSEGGLIVVDSTVGLVHLALTDDGGTCVSVKERTTLVRNKDLNHGLALSADGKTIYASSSSDVYSWAYSATSVSLDAASNRTLVFNMSNNDHVSRTLLLSRKYPDLLLVSRGSDSNNDDAAAELDSGHSQLRSFNISTSRAADDPYDFLDGTLLGWGLRNSVGVAEHPATGGIFTVENSVDQLRRHGKDIHADNPAEEMNFHGYLNGSKTDQGGNYGYPQCLTVWSTDNFPDLGDLKTGDQFPKDASGDEVTALSDDQCRDDKVAPVLAFQAHTAPLDIKFTDNGTEAFVSFHGSWNRDNPVGYAISTIAFQDGRPFAASTSKDAATPILSNPDLSKCPNECFRPVGLAWDAQGRLWFSSDSTGEIFVLQRDAAADGGGSNSTSNNTGGSQSGDDSAASHFMPGTGAVTVILAAVLMGLFLA
ncbi:hypothetical protein G7046_g2616 [Stylonectria norvegica]|nr:hypothetical protein G7046_g2616 [Stylonectria norvegica]